MSYQAGTITSPTPAQALMAAMDTVIQAHAAWDFVEQVVSGNNTARVYKNDKNISGLPNDFYVVIWRSADAGLQIYFSLCETWDAVGKLLVRYAPAPSLTSGSGSFIVPNADGSVGATGQAFTSPHVLAATTTDPLIIGNLFTYYLSVTNHRICFALRSAGWVYAGAYESLPGYYDPFPLVLLSNGHCGYGTAIGWDSSNLYTEFYWKYSTTTSVQTVAGFASTTSVALPAWCGSFTRQWRTVVQAASAWSVRPYTVSMVYPQRTVVSPYLNYRDVLGQRWYPSRVALNQGHASLGNTNNDCRGLLRDVMAIDPASGYPSNGDSMSIEGVDHVCMCRTVQTTLGEHFFVSKAA